MMSFSFHATQSNLTIPLGHVSATACELLEAYKDGIQTVLQPLAKFGLGQLSNCSLQVIDRLDKYFPEANGNYLGLVLFFFGRRHLVLVFLAMVASRYRIRLPTVKVAHRHGAHEHGLADGEEEHFGGTPEVQALIIHLHHVVANN